ncbi:uncharacterized protein BKA78DRAFT_328534 [Phyllosticta capitalensis]|uniref:uncharacterized protein n=1 Tax=Phyllosticta capitalensis TaxID=121624 RepID=UPI00312EAD33
MLISYLAAYISLREADFRHDSILITLSCHAFVLAFSCAFPLVTHLISFRLVSCATNTHYTLAFGISLCSANQRISMSLRRRQALALVTSGNRRMGVQVSLAGLHAYIGT